MKKEVLNKYKILEILEKQGRDIFLTLPFTYEEQGRR